VIGLDFVTGAEHKGILKDIDQFSDIPWPIMTGEQDQCLSGHPLDRFLGLEAYSADKGANKQRNALTPISDFSISFFWKTRNNFTWVESGRSRISSRKMSPWLAASKRPTLVRS